MLNFTRSGQGPALVLIHGYAGGLSYWTPQIVHFKGLFDVIAVDLPGFAGSADVPAPNSIAGYALSIIELLDHCGIERASILGFSMGGMIAQQAALDFPERLDAVILYGSSAVGDLPHRFESWEAAIKRIEEQGVEATTETTSATWFVEGKQHPYYIMCREAGRGANKEACIQVMRAMQNWRSVERLSEIDHPTLVIVGDKDRSTTPSDSMVLWEGITESEICILPGCAHGAHVERPDLFNEVVLDFLLRKTYSRDLIK